MDFSSISSLNGYIKNLNMRQKWQEKSKTPQNSSAKKGSINEWMEQQRQNIKENSNSGGEDKTLQTIHSKLELGAKLTADEEKYLQQKDPQAYQRLQSNKAAQKKFEQDLKKCKTKEEAQKLKQAQAASSLGYVKTIMNDSAIPKEKKLELVMSEHQKMTGIDKAAKKFVQSGEYSRLPSEAEKAEAERLIKEAKEAELRPAEDNESRKTEPEKELENNIGQKPEIAERPAEPARSKQAEKTIKAFDKAKSEKSETPENPARKAAIEAETSPVVQKVKRAKNAYPASGEKPTPNVSGIHIMEKKV